jgi:hypothetical protein
MPSETRTLPTARSLAAAPLRSLVLNHALGTLADRSFDFLAALPEDVRQPLIAEVLDLASYRLDAWATSLAARRLTELRRANPGGVRLGAYAWVEDVRPAAPLTEVSPTPPGTSGPLYRSDTNRGYVQAPSLTHAATAAVLRSGYFSDRRDGADGDSPLAVNLSSDRVRRAKWLLDGVRQGQPLAALLGYRFERGLHEHGLDRYIHRFRTLASLKDDDALAKAYEKLAKAEALAKEVSALYAQRDQASERAQQAQTLKAQREQLRLAYQSEVDAIDGLKQAADAAASEAAELGRRIADHERRKPRSRVNTGGRRYEVELIEEADVEAWALLRMELAGARQEALSREGTARSAFNARIGARAGALVEINRLDNRPPNADSIVAAQATIDAEGAIANELDRQALTKEGGTRGGAEIALTAARRELAAQLNRQWEQALESLAANNVVDGLELHRRWKAGQRRQAPQSPWDATTIPFGDAVLGFPGPGTSDFLALDAELRALDEWVDAVGDAVVAESVYQVVQGNPLRSGATLDAIASGEAPPPELEVIRTPRSGVSLTHRLLALFSVTAGAAPATWPINEHQVRAHAEPLLNAWAATLLPRPEQVRCKAAYADPATGVVRQELELPLTTLQLSPLDALYLSEADQHAQQSELEQRLAFHLLRTRPASLPADSAVRLSFARDPGWTPDIVSIGEFLEISRAARQLIAGARAADGRDLVIPGSAAASGLRTDELAQRVNRSVKALQQAHAALQRLLPPAQTEPAGAAVNPEALRTALLRLAHFSIQGAIPLAAAGEGTDVRDTLVTQARSVAREVENRLKRISGLTAAFDGTHASPEGRFEHDLSRVREVLGPDFRVVPHLALVNGGELAAAFGASRALQGDDPLAAVSWLQRAACVREGVARFHAAMTYAETVGDGGALSLQVGQLPVQPADRWVALSVAPNETMPGGRLSLVAQISSSSELRFDRPVAGLIIDEWVEVVPSRRETTGLTFHYDQSNSTAPQSLLLAVASDRRPVWDLDSLEAVLLNTIELARLRAAAPDIRAETVWVGDAVPSGATLFAEKESWSWVRLHPRPLAGRTAHQSAVVAGMHQHYFQGATHTLPVSVGDRLFVYVYIDPVNEPREVMLQWNDGSWEHRAYWGENLVAFGLDGTGSRRSMGALPPAGRWLRLEVPAALVGLEGRVVHGMAFTLWDGRATWGRAGLITPEPAPTLAPAALSPTLFFDGSAIAFSSVPDSPVE